MEMKHIWFVRNDGVLPGTIWVKNEFVSVVWWGHCQSFPESHSTAIPTIVENSNVYEKQEDAYFSIACEKLSDDFKMPENRKSIKAAIEQYLKLRADKDIQKKKLL